MTAEATTTDFRKYPHLLRLFQLISPTLPVGAFAYSQGMEWAVEAGWIGNSDETFHWICGVLENGQAKLDIPVIVRLYRACQDGDKKAFEYWNDYILAARGTAELQHEDRHMGRALYRLWSDLHPEGTPEPCCSQPSFTAMFAVAACQWRIDLETACNGLLWAWAENQVAAAIKLVPLGQTQGQIILMRIAERIPDAVNTGLATGAEDIGAITPALAMASAKHETQHTRLFRS